MKAIIRYRCLAFLVILGFFIAGIANSAAAYPSVYSNYEDTHDIRNSTESTHTFSFNKDYPGEAFQIFIPPGATYVSLRLNVFPNALIGAASRLGMDPQCQYNTSLNSTQYYNLPWRSTGSSNAPSMGSYLAGDIQMQNLGGTIRLMYMTTPQVTTGRWCHIKVLSYDGSNVGKINYNVSVNVAAYNEWYNNTSFGANGQPSGSPGTSGGYCSPEWSEGCQGDACGGTTCNESDKLACAGSGGTWNATTCVCTEPPSQTCPGGENGTVTLTNPDDNTTVSGNVNVSAAFSGCGLTDVEFFVNNSFSIGKDIMASGGVYSATWFSGSSPGGTYTIQAVAHGSGGSVLAQDQVTVTLSSEPGSEPEPEPEPEPGSDQQVFTSEVFPASVVNIVQVSGAINLGPTLVFPNGLAGLYNCYAAYTKDGDVYLAEQDISGGIIFQKFREGDSLKTFTQQIFSGETAWAPTVFSSLPNPNLFVVQTREVVFFLAVAPTAGGPMEGALFTFHE